MARNVSAGVLTHMKEGISRTGIYEVKYMEGETYTTEAKKAFLLSHGFSLFFTPPFPARFTLHFVREHHSAFVIRGGAGGLVWAAPPWILSSRPVQHLGLPCRRHLWVVAVRCSGHLSPFGYALPPVTPSLLPTKLAEAISLRPPRFPPQFKL